MERQVLQFMGAYTDLQDTMQFLVYTHLTDEQRVGFTKRNTDERILDAFKKLFRRELNVHVPETIPATYNGTRQYRNDLAHLLEIASIQGEPPNRTMQVVRYADYSTSGAWAMQNKRTVEIAETALQQWTNDLRHCRTNINVMLHIASLNHEFQWPDDHEIEVSWIPWWDQRWGAPPTEVNEKCFAPIGRYRAQTDPRDYWKPKDQWWTPPTNG